MTDRPPQTPKPTPDSAPKRSAFSPFGYASFTVIWAASVVSNIGTWMYNAASGWLMTDLNPDPLIVSLVQVATTAPMFLLALPAGALADILPRRRFLLVFESAITIVSAIFAAMISFHLVTAGNLLLFTFLIGAGSALTAPAWQAVVPQLVPRRELHAAIAANSVGFNISRALGPALGGLLAGAMGIAAPFWINAISNLGIVGSLWWWRPPAKAGVHGQPAERFVSAMRVGLRHARSNADLRATLARAVAFFLFSSAYWALLPLVAHDRIASGPRTLRLSPRRDRRRRGVRRLRDAGAERASSGRRSGQRGHARHRACAVALRGGADAGGGARRQPDRRRGLDRGAGLSQRRGAVRPARLGARARPRQSTRP